MSKEDVTLEITAFPAEWPELLECLKARYLHCKSNKLTSDDDEWLLWSPSFNRHCNKKDADNSYGDFSRLFKIWATYNRLLALHKLLFETETEAGKNGRQAIKKIIKQNVDMLDGQRVEFERSLKC